MISVIKARNTAPFVLSTRFVLHSKMIATINPPRSPNAASAFPVSDPCKPKLGAMGKAKPSHIPAMRYLSGGLVCRSIPQLGQATNVDHIWHRHRGQAMIITIGCFGICCGCTNCCGFAGICYWNCCVCPKFWFVACWLIMTGNW